MQSSENLCKNTVRRYWCQLSLIKALSDSGHGCETKWTKWIMACRPADHSPLNKILLSNKSVQHLENGKWGKSHTKNSLACF